LKRRARIAGNGPVEDIDPYVVFDRDNWACQRCGCRTPPSLRGTHVADAPELDHIVPLARGGTHTFDNVQLLCRQCNNRKSDTLEDEATERSQAEK
jgi:5-methylcytosine-specific restriction endonuclease McrA